MIKIENFSKKYSNKSEEFAVSNVSLKAEDGKITGILGPNGAGKTTIIKALCSIHYPTSGSVTVSDNSNQFYDCSLKPEITQNLTGYLPEQLDLIKTLTVAEYLEQTAYIHNIPEDEIKEKIKYVSKECGLNEVLSKKIGELSKGYKQRTAFASCLIYNPQNLILDEPVNGLDPAQIIQFRKIIKNASKNSSVLLSTHLMQEVEALCDYIYIINKGQIVAEGTLEQIISEAKTENIEQAFLKFTGLNNEN